MKQIEWLVDFKWTKFGLKNVRFTHIDFKSSSLWTLNKQNLG